MTTLNLTIPAELWLTSNQRHHWAEKARRTKALRQLAYVAATNARLPRYEAVHLAAHISYPPRVHRVDPHNCLPTLKAAIDGITDAGIFPDDDSRHLLGPDVRRDSTRSEPGTYGVRLTFTRQEVPF